MSTRTSKEQLQLDEQQMRDLYLSDGIPWVCGYSGGKDSTTIVQKVLYMLMNTPVELRRKKVHVISTDTMVEQPIVRAWVSRSLAMMSEFVKREGLPVEVHQLRPELKDSFWVNLIGRGYAAPRKDFRWCTDRLKIKPSNKFIRDVVSSCGSAIVVLGTRKAESAARAANMERYEKDRVRDYLSPNGSLPNSLIYSPIEDWSNDDVWIYLMQYENPWGCNNKELMAMYREGSADNECPLVVDSSTPSCGNSRFGCWVCTLVSEDKSLQAMIQNDFEKSWMTPLLDFRNEFAPRDERGKIADHEFRDYRRSQGWIKLYNNTGLPIPGPYVRTRREYLLRRLLEVQVEINESAMEYLGEAIELITLEEIQEIRRIWVVDKHEFCDSAARIYYEVFGHDLPDRERLPKPYFGQEDWDILEELTGDDYVELELVSSLLDIQANHRFDKAFGAKKSLLSEMEAVIRRCFYEGPEDAAEYARRQRKLRSGNSSSLLLDDVEADDTNTTVHGDLSMLDGRFHGSLSTNRRSKKEDSRTSGYQQLSLFD